MKIRDYLVVLVGCISIISSWFLTSYFGGFDKSLPLFRSFAIPCIWCTLFVYLYNKKYTYLLINSYLIFLLFLFADRLSFHITSSLTQLTYLTVSIFSLFVFILIHQSLRSVKPRLASILSYVVTFACYVIPLFYIVYAINFGAPVSRDVFYAILQSNVNESLEFVRDYFSLSWILLFFLVNIAVLYLLLRQEKAKAVLIEKSLLSFLVLVLAVFVFASRDQIRLYSFAKNTIVEYEEELAKFRQAQSRLSNDRPTFDALKDEQGETYIFVIGESLNKENMSLYGYPRNTSPLLSELHKNEGLLVSDNAYSVHTHTMRVLSQALTESDQFNNKDYYDSLSIINILDQADVETFWITNQQLLGEWDNLVSVIAQQADHLFTFNKSIGRRTETQEFDGAMIDKIKGLLAVKSKRNRVLFVHLMGSHGDYCNRFPEKYRQFSGELNIANFGNMKLSENTLAKLNCYDSSVLYNDFVISSLISLLEEKVDVSGLLYFSDHADDVIADLGHNSGNFSFEMTQIPLLFWLSDSYKTKYADKVFSLRENLSSLFSNDRIYDTFIGLLNIQTDKYKAFNDLTSSSYYMKEDLAKTLLGEISYLSDSNYRFQQKKNILKLQQSNEFNRIIPHRVNSVGKLKDIWSDGFRGYELDVRFGDHGQNNFIIGHDLGNKNGTSFEKFLDLQNPFAIEKIWVDFKNLTESNAENALTTLNQLDEKFELKDKLIIESKATGSFFSAFEKDGWHISYYLPTKKIIELQEENNVAELQKYAQDIVSQSRTQRLSAVSFDYRLYPFVKKHLEPQISNDIVYHTWDLSSRLLDSKLTEKIAQKKYYLDQRVKTVLLPFKSPYNF